MSATTVSNPLRYRGSHNWYVDIAVREAEQLGFAMQYASHPSGIGCFILRFIVHGKGIDPKNYKHLTFREEAKFLIPATPTTSAEVFNGVRLNKIAIPVFKPAVQHHEVAGFAFKFGVWPLVTQWVAAQVEAEGFTLTVENLQAIIRDLVILPSTPEESVTCLLEFPDLTAPEQQAAALKLVKKPVEDEDEDDSDIEEDGDEDEDDKEWLN
jgi:hypothetical protein